MRLKGKNYGNFFIAIQTMSGQIFVNKLTSKKWIAIKPVIIKMLNTPGFELTKRCYNSLVIIHSLLIRILIDGESAFSEKNVDSLGVNDLEVVRVWPSTARKVYMAERAIRTVGQFI